MPTLVVVAPGTTFGYLTVIEEVPRAGARGVRMMRCRCECGEQTVVQLGKLRSGVIKSCGCRRYERFGAQLLPTSRTEIPLHGKIAAGRVALIDEDDFELVAPYRWNVREVWKDGKYVSGPYALTSLPRRDNGGKAPSLLMHVLIMGQPWIDHIDGNTLDNRKSNLRLATPEQNARNRRMRQSGKSQYKGVALVEANGRWIAHIGYGGKDNHIGVYANETSAAYAYDMAAREHYGEFAHTNFEIDPPQAVLDAWAIEQDARSTPERRQAQAALMSEKLRNRQPVTHTCVICGGEYQTKAIRTKYCSRKCSWIAERERKQAAE